MCVLYSTLTHQTKKMGFRLLKGIGKLEVGYFLIYFAMYYDLFYDALTS